MSKGKSIDQKYMGPEPAFSGPIPYNAQFSKALAWYNYFYTVSDARPWLTEFVKNNFTKDELALYKRLPDWRISMTDCSLARLVNRGGVLPDNVRNNMLGRLRLQIQHATTIKEEKKETVQKPVVSIQERVKEKAHNIIADFEESLDEFYHNGFEKTKFSAYDLLKSRDAKSAQTEIISSYYIPLLEEIELAINKTDKQVVEAYAQLSKKKLTNYRDFVKMIIEDCSRFSTNKTAVRKPRKKKEKSATQLLKTFKYKKEDNENKLVSTDPINILAAQSVWLYNVKYKKLTVLNAMGPAGLTVKGTTIVNFDEASSQTKTLRKPSEVLPKVLTGGKVVLRKLMTEIKTKESPANGRVNADTIILKCIK